jgi:hypothetical protein
LFFARNKFWQNLLTFFLSREFGQTMTALIARVEKLVMTNPILTNRQANNSTFLLLDKHCVIEKRKQ